MRQLIVTVAQTCWKFSTAAKFKIKYKEWAMKKFPAFRFARVIVIFSVA
jgi:hypothetical protein